MFLIASQSKLNAQENFVSEAWAREGGSQYLFYKNTTKADDYGNVYVAGTTINVAGNYDIFLQKFNDGGDLIWEQSFDGDAHENDFAADIAFWGNSVYLTGASVGNTLKQNDWVILKFDSSPTVGLSLSSPNNGAKWSDFNYSINNNILTINTTTYIYNLYQNSIGQSISSWLPAYYQYSRTPISIHTHNPSLSNSHLLLSSIKLKIWPNPSSDIIFIDIKDLTDNEIKVRVTDLLGKEVYFQKYKINQDETLSIPINHLANGVYTLDIQTKNKNYYEKFSKISN